MTMEECTCKKYDSIPPECVNEFTYQDSGKTVKLEPRIGEKTTLISIDGCLITGGRKRCDCIFIYETKQTKYSFLVELKGKNEIEKAFKQLSLTRDYAEYQGILDLYNVKINKYVIVSDTQLNKPEIQKLEKEYNIRTGQILYSHPQKPYPDLKDKI